MNWRVSANIGATYRLIQILYLVSRAEASPTHNPGLYRLLVDVDAIVDQGNSDILSQHGLWSRLRIVDFCGLLRGLEEVGELIHCCHPPVSLVGVPSRIHGPGVWLTNITPHSPVCYLDAGIALESFLEGVDILFRTSPRLESLHAR